MGCYYSIRVWHSFNLHKVFTMHKNGGSGIMEKQPWAGAFITNVGFVFLTLSLYKHKRLQGPNTNTLHYRKKNKPIDRKCFVLQTNQPNVMDWNLFENVTSNVVWSIPLRKQFIKIEKSRKETCKFLGTQVSLSLTILRQCHTSVPMFFTFHVAVCNDQSTQTQETCESKVNITQLAFAFLSFFKLLSEGKKFFPFLCHFLDSHISSVFMYLSGRKFWFRNWTCKIHLEAAHGSAELTLGWIKLLPSLFHHWLAPLSLNKSFSYSASVPYWQNWDSASPIEVAQWHYGMLLND